VKPIVCSLAVLTLAIGFGLPLRATADPQAPQSFLGQQPPGRTPVVFAPGIVSTDAHEFSCSFSPDGSEFYFARGTGPNNRKAIMVARWRDGALTEPQVALPAFVDECFEPHVALDGTSMFFMGFRARPEQPRADIDMFRVRREGSTWGEIEHLGPPFNPANSMTPCTTRDGTMYTCSNQDIVKSHCVDGVFGPFEPLPAPVNTEAFEAYPYIAPDGSYLIFCRLAPEGGLMVTFHRDDGSWSEPRQIPLGMQAGVPSVSPDGKYLFFVAGRLPSDIYWVDAQVFLELRSE
jgi:hypothetical protein